MFRFLLGPGVVAPPPPPHPYAKTTTAKNRTLTYSALFSSLGFGLHYQFPADPAATREWVRKAECQLALDLAMSFGLINAE